MADNRCPNCGKVVPEGSKYCNYCGFLLASEMECPKCHHTIPSDSIFCPVCREMLVKDNTGDSEKAAREEQAGSHKTRYTFIILGILAFVGLFIIKQCFYSGNHREPIEVATGASAADSSSIDIFNRALEANNMKDDGSKIAYAMRVIDGQGKLTDKLIGVTYLSDDLHSFYKIYTLVKNGSDWDIRLSKTKYINGRTLVFDNIEMRTSDAEFPYMDNVNGKTYFYFAYLNLPQNRQGEGTVSTCYYDVESSDVVAQVDFTGEIVLNSEGKYQIISRSDNSNNGILASRLKEHAQNIGYLHIPTDEEIAAEKAEKAREEAEKARKDSIRFKMEEDERKAELLATGEEVQMEAKQVDKSKPLFRADEFSKKVNGPGYVVFLLKNGKVVAFNKRSNTNFEVHFGHGQATDIGWEDSEGGIVNIRTSNGKYQYNLSQNTSKKVG